MNQSTSELHFCCRIGDLAGIAKAYNLNPDCINSCDSSVIPNQQGWTPLYRGVNSGKIEVVKFLLAKNADPNAQNIHGETALHLAAETSQSEIAELLLSSKANPNCQQNDGETPLHLSAFKGDLETVLILLKYGASANIQNHLVSDK